MCLKRVGKKKILRRHNKVAKWLFNYFYKKMYTEELPEVFHKEAALLKSLQYSQDKQENTCVGVSF